LFSQTVVYWRVPVSSSVLVTERDLVVELLYINVLVELPDWIFIM
jgi:hypothetical protein